MEPLVFCIFQGLVVDPLLGQVQKLSRRWLVPMFECIGFTPAGFTLIAQYCLGGVLDPSGMHSILEDLKAAGQPEVSVNSGKGSVCVTVGSHTLVFKPHDDNELQELFKTLQERIHKRVGGQHKSKAISPCLLASASLHT